MSSAVASPPSTATDHNHPPFDDVTFSPIPNPNPNPNPNKPQVASRKRGRPKKLSSDVPATSKRKKIGPVYIVSQAERLSSGLLKNFPGAVAIVLPKVLLSEKAAKSPVLILPRGIQSLIDVSSVKEKRKKVGRPRIDGGVKRTRGRPRKPESVVSKGGWKIRDLLVDGSKDGILEVKKRPVGRPRKNVLVQGVVSAVSDVLV